MLSVTKRFMDGEMESEVIAVAEPVRVSPDPLFLSRRKKLPENR